MYSIQNLKNVCTHPHHFGKISFQFVIHKFRVSQNVKKSGLYRNVLDRPRETFRNIARPKLI